MTALDDIIDLDPLALDRADPPESVIAALAQACSNTGRWGESDVLAPSTTSTTTCAPGLPGWSAAVARSRCRSRST